MTLKWRRCFLLLKERKLQTVGLIDVLTEKGKYIGTGFYNSHSKIRIRLISRNANDRFDESFWEESCAMPGNTAKR